jgi:hypothetical protein
MSNQQPKSLTLTESERLRLERIALAFDIEISKVADGHYQLRSCNEHAPLDATLRAEIVHIRLLAEICSRAVHWIHFHFGKSCKDSLLELSNAKINRIAELYALHRDAIGGNEPVQLGAGRGRPPV